MKMLFKKENLALVGRMYWNRGNPEPGRSVKKLLLSLGSRAVVGPNGYMPTRRLVEPTKTFF